MASSTLYVVLVTASNEDEARQLADHCVRERLAACVNIIGPIRSVYIWQGSIRQDAEYLLIIKSAAENFSNLERAIRERHSYAVPEVIALQVTAGSEAYLNWALGLEPEPPAPRNDPSAL